MRGLVVLGTPDPDRAPPFIVEICETQRDSFSGHLEKRDLLPTRYINGSPRQASGCVRSLEISRWLGERPRQSPYALGDVGFRNGKKIRAWPERRPKPRAKLVRRKPRFQGRVIPVQERGCITGLGRAVKATPETRADISERSLQCPIANSKTASQGTEPRLAGPTRDSSEGVGSHPGLDGTAGIRGSYVRSLTVINDDGRRGKADRRFRAKG